jgi:hypothetical protein
MTCWTVHVLQCALKCFCRMRTAVQRGTLLYACIFSATNTLIKHVPQCTVCSASPPLITNLCASHAKIIYGPQSTEDNAVHCNNADAVHLCTTAPQRRKLLRAQSASTYAATCILTFMDNFPLNTTAAVRYRPYVGSQATMRLRQSQTCLHNSGTLWLKYTVLPEIFQPKPKATNTLITLYTLLYRLYSTLGCAYAYAHANFAISSHVLQLHASGLMHAACCTQRCYPVRSMLSCLHCLHACY